MSKIYRLLAIVILVVVPFSVFSNDNSSSKGKHAFWQKLDLTQEQRDKIKTIHNDAKDYREQHFTAVKSVREKIKAELKRQNPSEKVLNKYAEEMSKLHLEMMNKRHADLLEFKKILSPEQFNVILEQEGNAGKKQACKNKECKTMHSQPDIEQNQPTPEL